MFLLKKIDNVKFKSSYEVKKNRIGIGFEKLDRDAFDPEECYDFVAELGVKWVRIQSGWAKTEKTEGIYDFAWLDSIVDNLNKRELKVWMCLCYGNEIYDEDGCNKTGSIGIPPIKTQESREAWDRYVRACVEHFKGRVEYYEIWNEPDSIWCWKHGVNGYEYGKFANETAIAIKETDPNAKIFGASFCLGDLAFVQKAFEAGLGENIDYITYHFYKPDIECGSVRFMSALRAIIDRYNPKIGLIQGETGAQSEVAVQGAYAGSVWNERMQTKFLLRRMMFDYSTEVEFMSYFSMVDMYENLSGSDEKRDASHYGYFGLLKKKFVNDKPIGSYEKKPAFYAMQTICSMFSGNTEKVDLPIMFKVFDSIQILGKDEDPEDGSNGGAIYSFGVKKDNDSSAFVYWKPCNLMTTDFQATVSLTSYGLGKNIKLVDLYNGTVYSLDDKIEKEDGDIVTLKNIPICDYPLAIIFGDFLE